MRIALPLALVFLLAVVSTSDGIGHEHASEVTTSVKRSDAKDVAYAATIAKAMDRMHAGMADAPTTGEPRYDFLSQMIPHHQGAVDMAKAVLLATDDPEIRSLAQSIIVEQQYEIELMTHLLAAKADANAKDKR